MIARARYFAAVLSLVAFAPGWASAKPKSTTFADMVTDSPTIVVAKLAEKQPADKGQRALEVLRVLRGDVKLGALTVDFDDTPTVDPKAGEFVAFLSGNKVWRFVAVPLAG